MTEKKAIEILKNQIKTFDNVSIYKDSVWVSKTASYIKSFFGFDSEEYKHIINFKFDIPYDKFESEISVTNKRKDKHIRMIQYLENCIELIQNKGLYKTPKTNFLNRISETAIWTIISVSFVGLLTIGSLFGNWYSNTQNVELKIYNKKLEDSISSIYKHTNKYPQKKAENTRKN